MIIKEYGKIETYCFRKKNPTENVWTGKRLENRQMKNKKKRLAKETIPEAEHIGFNPE